MKTVAIIQARMGSSRLPGKVLADIGGKPMLWYVIERTRSASRVDHIVIATSTAAIDDQLADYCQQAGLDCFRGSENDVLDRYFQAASSHHADVVVRLTADCPLLDPAVIDKVIEAYSPGNVDYVTNTLGRTYPTGLDTEVFSFQALARAWTDARLPSEREHVTPYMRSSSRFRTRNVVSDADPQLRVYRWTVDDADDLAYVRAIYVTLAGRMDFSWLEVVELLANRPDIVKLQGKTITDAGYYRSLYHEVQAGPGPPLARNESTRWMERLKKRVSASSQTFSNVQTLAPGSSSALFISHANGCRVWDVDGNEYIDYIQGFLPNVLGHAHPAITTAVAQRLAAGHSFSFPHTLEVSLAEKLCALIPGAEMVHFMKNGSAAIAGAIRTARILTGRDHIACCSHRGARDGAETMLPDGDLPRGIPQFVHPFPYNDAPALEKLLKSQPGQFAAIVLEPIGSVEPQAGYLQQVRSAAGRHGALLIFDEVASGFCFGLGGAQKRHDVIADLACFGEAMTGGVPLGWIAGRAGAISALEERLFGSNVGNDLSAMAAAMAMLNLLETTDVLRVMESRGRQLAHGLNALASEADLQTRIRCVGPAVRSHIVFFDPTSQAGNLEQRLFQQEVIKRGILILQTHNMTAAHDEAAVEQTLRAYATVMKTLSLWLSDGNPSRFLESAQV